MVCHRNRLRGWIPVQQILQVSAATLSPRGAAEGKLQLLVEITVVESSLPIDTDQRAAHHLGQIRLTVAAAKPLLVGLQLAAGPQHAA